MGFIQWISLHRYQALSSYQKQGVMCCLSELEGPFVDVCVFCGGCMCVCLGVGVCVVGACLWVFLWVINKQLEKYIKYLPPQYTRFSILTQMVYSPPHILSSGARVMQNCPSKG